MRRDKKMKLNNQTERKQTDQEWDTTEFINNNNKKKKRNKNKKKAQTAATTTIECSASTSWREQRRFGNGEIADSRKQHGHHHI